ncbi:unnamed protein product [Discula destructiva]
MGFFHHLGTFLLFAATILLVITTITAPVVNDLGVLKVNLGNATSSHQTQIVYGTFGYCVTDTRADNKDYCTGTHVGYNATSVLSSIDSASFSHATMASTNALTKAMILHPIVLGMSFISFLLALGAGVVGSLLAALVSLLTVCVTIVALVIDFVLFSVLKEHVNSTKYDSANSHAEYGVAIWTILAAAVCSLLGAIIVFFSCCSARRQRNRAAAGTKNDYGAPAGNGRRW